MMDAHSIKYFLLMSLENIISKSIKDNNNPIGFDVFMDLALYHQEFGYYRSNKTIFGHRGDFITSPEVSDLFGFSLAKQCKQVLNGGNILEFGAGSGILAAQILFELGRSRRNHPECIQQCMDPFDLCLPFSTSGFLCTPWEFM